MRNRFVITIVTAAFAAVAVCFCSCGAYRPVAQDKTDAVTPEPEDTLEDASAEPEIEDEPAEEGPGTDDITPDVWGIYTESGGSASYEIMPDGVAINISNPGSVEYAVQLYCEGFRLLEGASYRFCATVSSDVPRYFEWRIQINGQDYHPYVDEKNIDIGPEAVTLSYDFTMEHPSDPAPRMCFNLGDEKGEQHLASHKIKISDMSLVITDDTNAKGKDEMSETTNVNVNQIGYRIKDEKRAIMRQLPSSDTSFEVVDISNGSEVYSANAEKGPNGGTSGDDVYVADFTKLDRAGKYIVRSGAGSSYEFEISDNVYDDALTDSLRMLYLQRCGCELTKELAGDFAHGVCHADEARIYGGKSYVEVSGGWHDAGDYGRYTSPAAKAVADLLLSYEAYPDVFTDDNRIPESGNGIPDILDEARYELDWLLKMQADDGGVYHKVTGLDFDGFVMPDECTLPLYVLPESKTATADFSGVMYMASRVYANIDPAFSEKCLSAANRALEAYIRHKDDRNFVNPSDVVTGEYGDNCSVDEFLWAICEGYKTTGDKRFERLLDMVDMSKITVDDLGWKDMSGYGYYAYLTAEKPMNTSLDLRGRFFAWADRCKDAALIKEAYGCTLLDDYPWGSNMYIANNGMALLMASRLTGNNDYRLAAKRQLDYILGANPTSYCFLTGYGTMSPVDPHHRPSVALGKCMKGMLVGGADSALDDPYAKATLSGLPKAKCYVDNNQTYSCNEVTIYWNSPLVYLLSAFSRDHG